MKNLIIVGGAGALGRGIVSKFIRSSWNVYSLDFTANEECENPYIFQITRNNSSILTQTNDVVSNLKKTINQVESIICVAGGWEGGSIANQESIENAFTMFEKNTASSLMTAHLAINVLRTDGLCVLTGAHAALHATPGMAAYGMSKVATHHLVATTAKTLSPGATVVGILPITIDTPMNRKHMPSEDFATWTKVDDIASKLLQWSNEPPQRPPSGHLVAVTTANNSTTWKDLGNTFL